MKHEPAFVAEAAQRAYEATLLTCSYRGDLDVCRMLCESADRFLPPTVEHRLFVPARDVPLFAGMASPRRRIFTQESLLPPWFLNLPMPGPRWRARLGLPRRDIYLTPYSRPVRGWIAQQIMKFQASANAETEIVFHVDSDNVFIRPMTLDKLEPLARQVRLYKDPQGVDLATHRTWHLSASKLLGLPPDEAHDGDYINPLVVWRRSVVRAMAARLAEIANCDWRVALARTPHFSEYIVYGVFAERVLGLEAAGHLPQAFTLCHSRWTDGFADAADETAFVEALGREHVICLVQSTVEMSNADRRRLFERVTETAARQDAGA